MWTLNIWLYFLSLSVGHENSVAAMNKKARCIEITLFFVLFPPILHSPCLVAVVRCECMHIGFLLNSWMSWVRTLSSRSVMEHHRVLYFCHSLHTAFSEMLGLVHGRPPVHLLKCSMDSFLFNGGFVGGTHTGFPVEPILGFFGYISQCPTHWSILWVVSSSAEIFRVVCCLCGIISLLVPGMFMFSPFPLLMLLFAQANPLLPLCLPLVWSYQVCWFDFDFTHWLLLLRHTPMFSGVFSHPDNVVLYPLYLV